MDRAIFVKIIGKDGQPRIKDIVRDNLADLKKVEAEIKAESKKTNSFREASYKTAESDIKRMARERARWEKEISREIQKTDKLTAANKIKEGKRSANQVIRDLKAIERESKQSANKSSSFFSKLLGASFFGSLGASAVVAFTSKISQIPSIVSDYLEQAQNAARKFAQDETALAQFTGSMDLAKEKIIELEKLALETPGLLFKGAIEGQKRLESINIKAELATTLLKGLANVQLLSGSTQEDFDAMLVNLVQIASGGQRVTQELREMATRMPAIVAIIEQEFGGIGDNLNDIKPQEFIERLAKAMALAPVAVDPAFEAAENLTDAYDKLELAIGKVIATNPAMVESNKIVAEQINYYTGQVGQADSETARFTDNAITKYAQLKASVFNVMASIAETFKLTGNIILGTGGLIVLGILAPVEATMEAISFLIKSTANSFINLARMIGQVASTPGIGIVAPGLASLSGLSTLQPFDITPDFNATRAIWNSINKLAGNARSNISRISRLDQEFHSIRSRISGSENTQIINAVNTPLTGNASTSGAGASGGGGGRGSSRGSSRSGRGNNFTPGRQAQALIQAAALLGIDPVDLATIIGYETGGTYSPGKPGGKGGNYLGLIQFGGEERRKYGVSANQSFEDQLINSVVPFLRDRFAGVGRSTQGASLLDLYRTVNGGNPTAGINLSDGNGTIIGHVGKMSRTHRAAALRRFFGGDPRNARGGGDDFDSGLSRAEEEELLKEERIRKARIIASRFGVTGGGDSSLIPTGRDKLDSTIAPLLNVDETFVKNFRDSLGIGERLLEVMMKRRNDQSILNALLDDYQTSLEEQLQTEKEGLFLAYNRNETRETEIRFIESQKNQVNALKDIEIDLGVFRRQNADDQFVAQRRLLEQKREEYSLSTEIAALQDRLANMGKNAALRYERAWLEAIYNVRDANIQAVESQIASQVRLADMMEIHTEQIRANVLDNLSRQKSLTETIGDEINDLYDDLAQRSDEFIDKTIGKIPIIGGIAKTVTRNALTRLTSGLLDMFFPGGVAEKTGNPVVDELKQSNKHLATIAKNTGGGGISGGGIGGNGLQLSNILRNIIPFNPHGGDFGGGGDHTSPGSIDAGSAGGASGGGSIWGQLKGLFGKGGIFGDQGFGNNVGTYGGIGAGANILGGLIGGRVGGVISGIGSGIAAGAAIGSIIPGIGTAIGAVVGGIAGLFGGLLGGDPKRKADKRENLPALQKGFADAIRQLNQILGGVRALRIDPATAIGQAEDIRSQIASGFGIQFQSKKYRKVARQRIAQTLPQADAIIADIREAADIAGAAGERQRRLLPEFADGGFVGRVPGMYDRRDDRTIRVSGNEVVLTPDVWQPITPYLKAKQVPGFANGGMVAGINNSAANANFNLYISGVTFDEGAKAWIESDDGQRSFVKVYKQAKEEREIA